MQFVRPVLLSLSITFISDFAINSIAHAIDHGTPDTLALEASIVSSDIDGSVVRVDLFAFNDADQWVGFGAGFQWNGDGLHLDSVQLSPLTWASFNGCFMSPNPCLPSQSEIDSSNAYQLFRAGLVAITGNGLDSSSSRKLLMSYWFTHEPGVIHFSIDTIVYSGATVMRVWNGESGPPYAPVWAGSLNFAPTDVSGETERSLPDQFTLHQNYPNPFNPSTTISFTLANSAPVRVDIIDLLGRTVATPFDGTMAAGVHRVSWNGQSDDGLPLSSGIYFSRVIAGESSQSRPMMLLK